LLFLFYEFFGVVTNLGGGWIAARYGLALTLLGGLALQIVALGMLTVDATVLSVAYVMAAQALSGIAKDLNKMSAKSSVKAIAEGEGKLYRLVSVLTGSKNALKGVGFFLGGALLQTLGFQNAMWAMMAVLLLVGLVALFGLNFATGKTSFKPKFADLLSKSQAVNQLSGARFFLFGARDVWFVVALPVYLQTQLDWSSVQVGTFLAVWIMGYGAVQASSPHLTRGGAQAGRKTMLWGLMLLPVPALIAISLAWFNINPSFSLVAGLLIFGALFAINSALHSYLIVSYADADGVSLDVGFYYMSNAAGRLVGTVLSGLIFQFYGLIACLLAASLMLVCTTLLAARLPDPQAGHGQPL
ncbi:MAG: organoarsenical effux MFS transporter ArsJ, partial [Pseudomonadota bacterium]